MYDREGPSANDVLDYVGRQAIRIKELSDANKQLAIERNSTIEIIGEKETGDIRTQILSKVQLVIDQRIGVLQDLLHEEALTQEDTLRLMNQKQEAQFLKEMIGKTV